MTRLGSEPNAVQKPAKPVAEPGVETVPGDDDAACGACIRGTVCRSSRSTDASDKARTSRHWRAAVLRGTATGMPPGPEQTTCQAPILPALVSRLSNRKRARSGTVCHRHLQGGSRWPPGCVPGRRVARQAWVQQGGRRDPQAVCIADEQVRCSGAGFAELNATHAGRGRRIQPVARQLNQQSFNYSRQGNWLGDSRAGHGLGRDAARPAEGRVSVPLSAPDLGTTVQMPCHSRRPHLVPHALRDQPGTGLLILGRPASPQPTNLLAGGT